MNLCDAHAALARIDWTMFGWNDPVPAEVDEDTVQERFKTLNGRGPRADKQFQLHCHNTSAIVLLRSVGEGTARVPVQCLSSVPGGHSSGLNRCSLLPMMRCAFTRLEPGRRRQRVGLMKENLHSPRMRLPPRADLPISVFQHLT